jgi:hypothetical protein
LLTDLAIHLPQEWQKQDSGADFDVIRTALDQMEQAVRAGEYELAESARLEAYAVMEIGPEAKLIALRRSTNRSSRDISGMDRVTTAGWHS